MPPSRSRTPRGIAVSGIADACHNHGFICCLPSVCCSLRGRVIGLRSRLAVRPAGSCPWLPNERGREHPPLPTPPYVVLHGGDDVGAGTSGALPSTVGLPCSLVLSQRALSSLLTAAQLAKAAVATVRARRASPRVRPSVARRVCAGARAHRLGTSGAPCPRSMGAVVAAATRRAVRVQGRGVACKTGGRAPWPEGAGAPQSQPPPPPLPEGRREWAERSAGAGARAASAAVTVGA